MNMNLNMNGLTRQEQRDLMDELQQQTLDNAKELAALDAYYDLVEEEMEREYYASCLEDDYDADMDDYDLYDDEGCDNDFLSIADLYNTCYEVF